ncbi:MAG: hypothetical protein IOC90_01475 [Methylocystis sp.]|jgi:hypothetical protein|nr:hypothetical protein [Methylocystis sp.]MCA3584051.1 hypothetical protein [Methylocystis sp.]MCA3586695.1 hypothetical protein [Methylocystis sp.]MCA3591665.1 hypothetical protein [Methylocystis sp.]
MADDMSASSAMGGTRSWFVFQFSAANDASDWPDPTFNKHLAAADERFGKVNQDCVRVAQSRFL